MFSKFTNSKFPGKAFVLTFHSDVKYHFGVFLSTPSVKCACGMPGTDTGILQSRTKYLAKVEKSSKKCYCLSLISGTGTGHRAMSPQNLRFFQSFLISNSSATREATRIPSLLYQISNFVLLVATRTCSKTLQSCKILRPGFWIRFL